MFNILLLPNNRRANPGIFNDERLGWIERSVGWQQFEIYKRNMKTL